MRREEAVTKLHQLIQNKLSNGAELRSLVVAVERHGWLKKLPVFDEDDPLVQDWKKIMEENRLSAEEVILAQVISPW